MRRLALFSLLVLAQSFVGCTWEPSATSTVELSKGTSERKVEIHTLVPTPFLAPNPTQKPSLSSTVVPELILSRTHPEISYTIPLTSQWVTPYSAIVHFALDDVADGFLFYGPLSEGRFTEVLPFSKNDSNHLISIAGLEENTTYQTAVGILFEGDYLPPKFLAEGWDPIQFHTPAEDKEPLRIGVIGDSGFGEKLTFDLVGRMASYDLDYLIHTGDLVYRAEDNLDAMDAFLTKYYQPFSPLLHQVPVLAVPGNHEYDPAAQSAGHPYYFTAFPRLPHLESQSRGERRRYYALELGGVQFLFLDSQSFWVDADVEGQSLWLKERLADGRYPASIPILHVPPFSSGLHNGEGTIIEQEWVPLFEKFNVPLVLSGHDHNYQRIEVHGITYLISGGGSSVIYPMSESHPGSRRYSASSHFLLISLYQDHIDVQAISASGEFIDRSKIPLVKD